jgi:hypothetical protein
MVKDGGYTQPEGPENATPPSQRIPTAQPQDVTTANTNVGDSELVQLWMRVKELQRFWDAEHRLALELSASTDLHSRMMERARKLWQEAHPDKADWWIDGAKNVVWMVEENARLRMRVAELERLEWTLAGTRFARAELEQEVARLQGEIGVCDKHGTINQVIDTHCEACYEEYCERKGYR